LEFSGEGSKLEAISLLSCYIFSLLGVVLLLAFFTLVLFFTVMFHANAQGVHLHIGVGGLQFSRYGCGCCFQARVL
jgi:hypothetical protein